MVSAHPFLCSCFCRAYILLRCHFLFFRDLTRCRLMNCPKFPLYIDYIPPSMVLFCFVLFCFVLQSVALPKLINAHSHFTEEPRGNIELPGSSLCPPHSVASTFSATGCSLRVTGKEPLTRGVSHWVPSTWNHEHHDTSRTTSQQQLVMRCELGEGFLSDSPAMSVDDQVNGKWGEEDQAEGAWMCIHG